MQENEELFGEGKVVLDLSVSQLIKESKDTQTDQKKYRFKSQVFPLLQLNPNIAAFTKQVCHEINNLKIPF